MWNAITFQIEAGTSLSLLLFIPRCACPANYPATQVNTPTSKLTSKDTQNFLSTFGKISKPSTYSGNTTGRYKIKPLQGSSEVAATSMASELLHAPSKKPPKDPSLKTLISMMKQLRLNMRVVLLVSYEQTQGGITPFLEVCIEEKNRTGSHQHTVCHPRSDKGRIRVIKQEVKVCVKPKWIFIDTATPRIVRRLYHVRLLRPRQLFRGCTCPPKPRKTIANPPPKEGSSALRLRGGILGHRKKGRQALGDDDPIPAHIWWFAGGKPGSRPPTRNQLRQWKEKSRGDWDEGKKRGFFQEIIYVLSDGRLGRDQWRPKGKKKKQTREQERSGRSTQRSGSDSSDEDV